MACQSCSIHHASQEGINSFSAQEGIIARAMKVIHLCQKGILVNMSCYERHIFINMSCICTWIAIPKPHLRCFRLAAAFLSSNIHFGACMCWKVVFRYLISVKGTHPSHLVFDLVRELYIYMSSTSHPKLPANHYFY